MDRNPSYGVLVKMLSDAMECHANRELQAHNLTFSQSKLLRVLSHEPDGTASLKTLETRFNLAQSTMAGLAARMERKGLVESYHPSGDKRVKHLRLTDAGRLLNEQCHADFLASEEMLVARLSPEERMQLQHMLTVMLENVRTSNENHTGKE